MISKKRMVIVGAVPLAFAVAVGIMLRPNPQSLTSDELYEALSQELGISHVELGFKSDMTGIDASMLTLMLNRSPNFINSWLDWKKVRILFGTEEWSSIVLTDRGVTPTTLCLISRTSSVHVLYLTILRPLDDDELRVLGDMRGLDYCALKMNSFTIGLSDLEKLQRLSNVRELELELKLEEMNAKVVASLTKMKNLQFLVIHLPTDYEEKEARDTYDELNKEILDCVIHIGSQGFEIP